MPVMVAPQLQRVELRVGFGRIFAIAILAPSRSSQRWGGSAAKRGAARVEHKPNRQCEAMSFAQTLAKKSDEAVARMKEEEQRG